MPFLASPRPTWFCSNNVGPPLELPLSRNEPSCSPKLPVNTNAHRANWPSHLGTRSRIHRPDSYLLYLADHSTAEPHPSMPCLSWQRHFHQKSIPTPAHPTTHRLMVDLVNFAHTQHIGSFGLEQSAHIAFKRGCGIAGARHEKR